MDEGSLRPERRTDYGALADAIGHGRGNVQWLRAIALGTTALSIGLAGWLAYEIKTKPVVETVFVLVNEETRVLATIGARTWTFGEQEKADVARQWVRTLRTRTLDDLATRTSRTDMLRITAKGEPAIAKANTMLLEMDGKLERLGLQVGQHMHTTVRPSSQGEDGAPVVVDVRWQERTYDNDNKLGPWQSMSMAVLVKAIEPETTAQIMANGHGLYVTDISAFSAGPQS